MFTHLVTVRFDTQKSSATSADVIKAGTFIFITSSKRSGGWKYGGKQPPLNEKIGQEKNPM
ncbi:hypothetical protein [Escherichia coli]|uniref:hypothetical protein n=1 Tax=Escherichia coli TaxID=562 RepID=UPI0006A6483A|nr:hypothetical protein [Escherichia coli]